MEVVKFLAKCTNQPNAPDETGGWTPLRIATAEGLKDIMKFLASCSDNQCWGCSEYGKKEKLKTCTKCKLAKYHDSQCQKDDWTIHQKFHFEMGITKAF